MRRIAVVAFFLCGGIVSGGCGAYGAWSKRREAKALEQSIEKQQAALKRMSPEALTAAEAESRDRAIAQYEKILRDYQDVGREEMDEALYLLGKLLFEREQQAFQRSQQSYDEARARAEAAHEPAPEEPKPRYPSAKAIYERLLHDFPDSSLREDALYDLGYILFEEGAREEAAKLFLKLLKEKPRSHYAAEVNFRLGEYEFESYRLSAAESHYQAVLRQGQTDFTEKALFKLGWVYYNLDRFDDAKKVLADLLKRESRKMEREGREFAPAPILFFPGPRHMALPALHEPKGSELYEETLEIIARVFAESGGADGLVAFVKSQQPGRTAPPYAAPLMHRLALVEKERSQFPAAERAYELLLATYPTFRDAPQIELELVKVLVDQKDLDRAARVREAMLGKYDRGSPWARANPEQEVREAALKAARKGLAWSIRYYHARALELQKEQGGVPDELRRAISLYEKYLARFPDGKASYTKRFRYGQALFAAGEYAKAADVFRIVSFDAKFDAKREAAAFARVLTAEKGIEGRKPPLPQPLIDAVVAAYEDYITLDPASDKNAALLFKEGNLYFAAENFPPAIAAFERLIHDHPGDPLAVEANDLIAQAHFKLGDFAVAEQWSEKALAAAGPGNPLGARRGEVENLYALTMFKQGEKADEEKKYTEAKRHYLRIADRLPQNEVAVRALYNAASSSDRAGGRTEAAALLERLLNEYATSELAPDAAVKLAELYKDQPGADERIMRVYELVADAHVDSPKGEEFLFHAAKLAAKAHDSADTVRLFEKFLSRYRSIGLEAHSERTVEAFYHLGTSYAALGNSALARANLEEFLSRPRPAKASFGEEAEGYAYAVANANLILGKALAQEYASVRLTSATKETLRRKQSLLDAVVGRLTPAVASGISPIATEASFDVGSAYEEFAQALLEAPKPAGLSVEERDEYERLLEQQVRPFLLKAVDAYRLSVRAAREKAVSDEWVGRSRARLAAVAPRVFHRDPRPGYMPLPAGAEPPPALLATYAGVGVAPGSGPGFFGSLVANDADARRAAFAKGLAAAQQSPPDWSEAARRFAEAAGGGAPEAGYDEAVALLQLGKPADASRVLDAVVARAPDLLPALSLAGRVYASIGRKDLAASLLGRAAASPSATTSERLAWAAFLERERRTGEALAVYRQAAATDPRSGEAALGAARLGGAATADALEALVPLLGRSPSGLVELGILAAEKGFPRVAARAFASARAVLPASDRTALAIVVNDEALAALANHDTAQADMLLASAARADPALPALGNGAGILRMQKGEFEAAENEFRKATAAAPTYGAPWANLGILNELYFGAPDQAVDCYNRYLATRPSDGSVVTGWIEEIREGGDGRRKKI